MYSFNSFSPPSAPLHSTKNVSRSSTSTSISAVNRWQLGFDKNSIILFRPVRMCSYLSVLDFKEEVRASIDGNFWPIVSRALKQTITSLTPPASQMKWSMLAKLRVIPSPSKMEVVAKHCTIWSLSSLVVAFDCSTPLMRLCTVTNLRFAEAKELSSFKTSSTLPSNSSKVSISTSDGVTSAPSKRLHSDPVRYAKMTTVGSVEPFAVSLSSAICALARAACSSRRTCSWERSFKCSTKASTWSKYKLSSSQALSSSSTNGNILRPAW